MPEEMVNEALNRAPKSFVLGTRNPEFKNKRPSQKSTVFKMDAIV